jgi:hypothetical protein
VLPVSPPAVSKGRWFNLSDKQIAAVVIGGVLIFGWVGSRFGSPRAAPTERPAATVEAWSVPAGFTKVAGETIAYRWDETPNCSIADTCWGLEVVSKHGCPDGLYVELTTLTAGGDVVGYANDTVGSVRAGETAILSFDNFERDEGATKARIGEVSCR